MKKTWLKPILFASLPLALAFGALLLQPKSTDAKEPLGKRWPNSQRISINQIIHKPFDRLLQTYVDADGYVDYAAWQANRQDRRTLRQYLVSLSQAGRGKSATKAARLAFWINAYNAVTIEGILQEYPTSSIRNHTAKLYGYNIWKHLPLYVGNQTYSLDSMEHQILRNMGEPRIHFAIVCASVGCPRLYNRAYTADKLEQQLTLNTKDFFSRTKNLRVETGRNVLHLSAILDWFGSDFGKNKQEQLAYWRAYMPKQAQQIAGNPQVQMRFLDYDWSLNDQARLKPNKR